MRWWTSASGGRLSRNRFIVRLCKYDGVEGRDEGAPQPTAAIAPKSKEPGSGRRGDDKVDMNESSDSDRLRLRTIVGGERGHGLRQDREPEDSPGTLED